MQNANEIIRILRDEYGISSEKELNEAIARLGKIDISPFCVEVRKKKEIAS